MILCAQMPEDRKPRLGHLRHDGCPAPVFERQMLEDVQQRRHDYAVRRSCWPGRRVRGCERADIRQQPVDE